MHMNNDILTKKVLDVIKKYNLIEENDKIIVGVSGGPDSLCLIDILNNIKDELKFDITCAHVNHMIRKEASDDEEFVKKYCEEKKIPFLVKHVPIKEISKMEKIGTEEAGRNARYEFFDEVLKKTNGTKIATAHTKNDNAETVLMNIFRGSGIKGLKGIEPIRENKYIRPLIDVSREEIEDYCERQNLKPKHDKTNDENIYTRNKVRNIVLPQIKEEFNPNIIETIDRLSKLIRSEDNFLDKLTEDTYKEILIKEDKEGIILNLREFNKKDEVIKSRIILYSIKKLFGDTNGIEKVHIDDIIKLCKNNIGNKYLTPNKHTKVFINKGKLSIFVT